MPLIGPGEAKNCHRAVDLAMKPLSRVRLRHPRERLSLEPPVRHRPAGLLPQADQIQSNPLRCSRHRCRPGNRPYVGPNPNAGLPPRHPRAKRGSRFFFPHPQKKERDPRWSEGGGGSALEWGGAPGERCSHDGHGRMVLPVRIELTTSALPRMRSTTELRQHRRGGRRALWRRGLRPSRQVAPRAAAPLSHCRP